MINRQSAFETLRTYSDGREWHDGEGTRFLDHAALVDEHAARAVVAMLDMAFEDAGYEERCKHPADYADRIADLIGYQEATYVPLMGREDGHWIPYCSNCRKKVSGSLFTAPDYCPHCGAKLEGASDGRR